jgi:hypothetical protein
MKGPLAAMPSRKRPFAYRLTTVTFRLSLDFTVSWL